MKSRTFNFRSQYGLNFDGVNEKLTGSITSDSNNWTISCWIKKTANPAGYASFVEFVKTSSLYRYGIGVLSSGYAVIAYGAGKYRVATTTLLSNNVWYFVSGSYNGTSLHLYVNEVSQSLGSELAAANGTSSTINIGGSTAGAGAFFFNGIIDEVSYFDTKITNNQTKEILNGRLRINLTTHSAQNNLKGYWRLGDYNAVYSTNWTIPNEKGSLGSLTSTNMELGDLTTGLTL